MRMKILFFYTDEENQKNSNYQCSSIYDGVMSQ